MPKYRQATEIAKAIKLSKDYIKSGLNQSRLAEKKGVTSQSINQMVNRLPVQTILQTFLVSKPLDETLVEVAKEGLCAKKPIGASILVQSDGTILKSEEVGTIEVPDHTARHKYWHDFMVAKGHLRPEGNGNAPIFIQFNVNLKRPNGSPANSS